jgi:very-short-patch-repair endonuclease
VSAKWTGNERDLNEELRRIALECDGVIEDSRLVDLGLSRSMIETRVANGRLVRLFRLVYVLPGTRLSARGRWRASVSSVGGDACLSHGSALALHGLVRDGGPIHVVSRSGACRVDGTRFRPADPSYDFVVEIHQTRRLPDSHVCHPGGIRSTTVDRALLDFAAGATNLELVKALSQGEKERKIRWGALRGLTEKARGHKGVGKLRFEIERWDPAFSDAQSDPEIDFLFTLRREGLPMPMVNASIGRFVADFFWADLNLVAEMDPWGTHKGRETFRRDHRKSIELEAKGFRVIRFTWEDLYLHEDRMVHELRAIMEQQRSLATRPAQRGF